MPLYEYACEGCGQHFELIRKFSDPPVETCIVCGGPVRKVLSSPAVQFKGTGWYVTDYARKGHASAGRESSETESAKGASGDSTTPAGTPAKSDSGTR